MSSSIVREVMGKFGKRFYAVKVGRTPGIYNTWAECEAEVLKHPGAVYKCFSDYSEAESFVKSEGRGYGAWSGKKTVKYARPPKPSPDSSGQQKDPVELSALNSRFIPADTKALMVAVDIPNMPVVYSDGCCFKNGKSAASGGVGIFWGHDSTHNISEKLKGPQTNQRAELVAACRAIESALQQGHSAVEIRTDSVYTIKSATEWISKWKGNGWLTADKKDVKNKQDMQRLDQLCKLISIKWTHVRGHVGIPGNEAADALAKAGSLLPS